MKQPLWRTLHIPGGRAPVRYTYQGGRRPLVCLHSLLRALGLAWGTWWPLCLLLAHQQGWPLPVATGNHGRDAQGRLTRLLPARRLPGFLAALAPQVARTYPAGGNRIAIAAEQLRVDHFEAAPCTASAPGLKPPQNAPSEAPQASAPAGAQNGHSGRFAPPPKQPAVTITREVEAQALALAAQGHSRTVIARRLGISKSSATQLVNGKYRFAAEQAARPRLTDAVPMRHARTGRPARVSADTGRQVLALHAQGYAQAEVARRLGLSRATVNLLVHGKYKFGEGTHA